MAGLEKALFNLKVLHDIETPMKSHAKMQYAVHGQTTQPAGSESEQRRADREGKTEKGISKTTLRQRDPHTCHMRNAEPAQSPHANCSSLGYPTEPPRNRQSLCAERHKKEE